MRHGASGLPLTRMRTGIGLRQLLRLEISHADLSDAQLDRLLDPAGYLGSAVRFTHTVLADYALWKESWLSHN